MFRVCFGLETYFTYSVGPVGQFRGKGTDSRLATDATSSATPLSPEWVTPTPPSPADDLQTGPTRSHKTSRVNMWMRWLPPLFNKMITFRPDKYFISFLRLDAGVERLAPSLRFGFETPQPHSHSRTDTSRKKTRKSSWHNGGAGGAGGVPWMIAMHHKLETGPNVFAPPNSVWAIQNYTWRILGCPSPSTIKRSIFLKILSTLRVSKLWNICSPVATFSASRLPVSEGTRSDAPSSSNSNSTSSSISYSSSGRPC